MGNGFGKPLLWYLLYVIYLIRAMLFIAVPFILLVWLIKMVS